MQLFSNSHQSAELHENLFILHLSEETRHTQTTLLGHGPQHRSIQVFQGRFQHGLKVVFRLPPHLFEAIDFITRQTPIAVSRSYKGTDVRTFSGDVTRAFLQINRRNLDHDDLSILKRNHINLHADGRRHDVADLHHGGKNLLRIKPFHRREIRLFRQA